MTAAKRILLTVALLLGFATAPTPVHAATAAPGVKVAGNQLVSTVDGSPVQFRGVNRSGTEYACLEGWGFFDGPADTTSVAAIKAYGANAVRVSLNENCWLGNTSVKASYRGSTYQTQIRGFVQRLTDAGLYVILDDHGHKNGNPGQSVMPGRATANKFWGQVANTFKDKANVAFDLYNEPYPDRNRDTIKAWTCVRDGGSACGLTYTAAGYQEMLNAVRAAGATNVVMAGGPQYSGVLDRWLTYAPKDPAGQLAASIHIYYNTPADPEYAPCYRASCWDKQIAPVAAKVPVVIGEIGEFDCTFNLINGTTLKQPSLVAWADQHHVSYLAWSWIASKSGCKTGPTLISNYNGTANASYGTGYKAWLKGTH